MRIRLFFFLFILLFAFGAKGQIFGAKSPINTMFKPGYIITSNSDTLRGYVKYAVQIPYHVYHHVLFKDSAYGKSRKYLPEEIIGFKSLDYEFFSIKEPELDGFYFMQKIVDDYTKLYVRYENVVFIFSYSVINVTPVYYLVRPNEKKLTRIDQFGFKKSMTDYFKDKPELVEKINAGKNYRYKDLKKIVEEYNKYF